MIAVLQVVKGNDEFYPPKVYWVKCHVKNDRCKLTEEEVQKMADATHKPRDKTLIQCLYETGCRIGELLTIQIKNVVFDNFGFSSEIEIIAIWNQPRFYVVKLISHHSIIKG